jgi:RNA polymerase sigma-70 factor, ECF subfamily
VSEQVDNQLVKRVAQGDESAFMILYDRYASRVYSLTLRVLGDPMLAEEATQDTFLKLWGRATTYSHGQGAFISWLLTITRRTALDRLRLENRRIPASMDKDPEETWSFLPDQATTSSEVRWRSLYFAVQSLPEEQRQVIDLAFYKGLSQSEISEILGWPLGTVKTRIRSAMLSLRQHWTSESDE